ncbi:MAG TPA: hypothetical protein VJU77_17475 [Chthoniobacterales bacterium]|nr:hypothetical protein [Chthoniobacterales bacterium]
MKPFLPCLATLLFVFPVSLTAHRDLAGDVFPIVKVENGNFAIYFYNNARPSVDDNDIQGKNRPVFRIVYSPGGELLGPRARSDKFTAEALSNGSSMVYDKTIRVGDETVFFENDLLRAKPSYSFEKNGVRQHRRLPWPEKVEIDYVADALVDERSLALSVALEKGKLAVYHFDRTKFEMPASVVIGEPTFIYDFPRASNLVRVEDRYWLGWIRYNREKDKLETILSDWKPGEEKAHDTLVDLPTTWNTEISLAAIGNDLCLAYAGPPADASAAQSRIVTLFRKTTELTTAH